MYGYNLAAIVRIELALSAAERGNAGKRPGRHHVGIQHVGGNFFVDLYL